MGVSSSSQWPNRQITRFHGDLTRAMGSTNMAASATAVPHHHDRAISSNPDPTIENFLREIERDRPMRFSPQQIAEFTRNFSSPLGAGGFGVVYKGTLPNGLAVAVKVLRGGVHDRSFAEQFMAEVGTIGRTRHVNLVRLLGFCFDDAARALVYEYTERGALDAFLLRGRRDVGIPALLDIVAGVARGIRTGRRSCTTTSSHDLTSGNPDPTVENFLREMERERPMRFSPQQIAELTRNYSSPLGAGGFGVVYKGTLPNGLAVAVKVLRVGVGGHVDRSSAEQFMAEVGTIGRTHHVNLVRLFGFCFDDAVRALVYEFMELGALDAFLLHRGRDVGLETLRSIAVGVARGIRYLHEECQQKIMHYDIKPGNVLLDGALTPKVADFGLARLVSRAATHVTVSGPRGTPGFAAPEMWRQSGVTEKCDVYSFGMLLFEIAGLRRNFDEAAPDSQRWFPKLAWTKYENGELMDLVAGAAPSHGGVDDVATRRKEMVERMFKVAFWCVQEQPEARPPIGVVVKMLEGEMDIAPPVNPFHHLMAPPLATMPWTTTSGGDTVTAPVGLSEASKNLISL